VASTLARLGILMLSLLAQERTWTRERKEGEKRDVLHGASQLVRGDSGRWRDEPELQHAPPIERKPAKTSLDDWADGLKEKDFPLTTADDSWLIFRTKQLDDNDRVWVERIERRESKITVVAHQAKWQGRYFKTFTYYPVIAVKLGKLEEGKYDVEWVVKPLTFSQFDGDGKPLPANGPKDERPAEAKPVELKLTFTVAKATSK
jgi:hypothetical protein